MGHPGRWCLRCGRGFLRCQKESLVSSRAPALFAGERDLSERFLGPTENVGPRNDNGADHPGHGSVECQRTEVTDPPSPTNRVGEDGAPSLAVDEAMHDWCRAECASSRTGGPSYPGTRRTWGCLTTVACRRRSKKCRLR